MARCKACGTEAPPMARFCSICGAAVAPATAAPPAMASGTAPARRVALPLVATAAPVQAQGGGMNKAAIIALVSGIGLIGAAAFLFVKSAGVLNAQKPTTPVAGVINAPNTQPLQAPILTPPNPGLPKNPILQPPTTIGNPMPEDIIAWLRWLKWFEGERKRLESKSTGELILQLQSAIKEYTTGESMGLLGDGFANGEKPDKPAPNYGAAIGKVIQEWNQADGVYKAPAGGNKPRLPDACAPLASNYGQALDAGIQEMTKLMTTMNTALQSMSGQDTGGAGTQDALKSLMAAKGSKSASKSVDALFNDSNAALDSLRSRYTDIPPDISGNNFRIVSEGASLSLPIMGM